MRKHVCGFSRKAGIIQTSGRPYFIHFAVPPNLRFITSRTASLWVNQCLLTSKEVFEGPLDLLEVRNKGSVPKKAPATMSLTVL